MNLKYEYEIQLTYKRKLSMKKKSKLKTNQLRYVLEKYL